MQLKKQTVAAALALAFGGAAQAADVIQFDTQTNGVITVGSFDWTVDNALADEAIPLAPAPAESPFTLFAQASLGNFVDPNGKPIVNTGLNQDYEITFQAGFGELGSSTNGGLVGNFHLDPNAQVNFFNVFYDTNVDSNPLTGQGYGNGQLILSGAIVSSEGQFRIIDLTPVPLDQFGDNNYPGITTVSATGSNTILADVQFQDFAFFLSNISALIVDLNHNSNLETPFRQTNPSAQVVGVTPEFGAGGLNGGPCAGEGSCDFLLQQDSNTSFQVSQVPEPSALALLGLSLGMLGFGRKQEKK